MAPILCPLVAAILVKCNNTLTIVRNQRWNLRIYTIFVNLPMPILFAFLLILVILTPDFAAAAHRSSGDNVSVHGYTRKDGTYVAPHMRSRPDGNLSNNWTTLGNVNPYTGKPGTRADASDGSPNDRSRSSDGAASYQGHNGDRPGFPHAASSPSARRTAAEQSYQCSNSSGKVGVGSGRLSQEGEYSDFLKRSVHSGEFLIFKYQAQGKEYWFKRLNCTRL